MCCRGNRHDVISAFKVLPNNRVAKIFIVCLHYELSFSGIFHRFTKTIATKKTLSSLLNASRIQIVFIRTSKEYLWTSPTCTMTSFLEIFLHADSLHCERKFERSPLSARCGGLPCVSLSLCRVNLRMCICWSNEIVSYIRQNRKKHVHPTVVNYRTNFFSSSCSKWNLVLKRWLLQWIQEEMLETFQMHFFHQIALSSKIRKPNWVEFLQTE